MAAMMMYTHDNHDLFPPNPDDGGTTPGYHWCAGEVEFLEPNEPIIGAQTFNPDILADPKECLITTYLNSNVTVFRCTADLRMGLYQGSDPAKLGTIVPAARTISMSSAVGTIDPGYASGGFSHSGVPNLPVTGAWLTGTRFGNNHNAPWRTYGKTADMIVPAPSSLIVVTEEDPFSINDGVLGTCVATPTWVDWPSTLHNMGCVISFGDGHVEFHKWHDASTRLTGPAYTAALPPTSVDWNWVASHISARAY